MPSVAQRLLLTRLRQSGNWERSRRAFRETTRKTLALKASEQAGAGKASPEDERSTGKVGVDLEVASVHLGRLYVEEKLETGQEASFRHLLEMIAESLSDRLFRETRTHHPALPRKISLAVRYLRENYREPVSLCFVARRVELSQERLSRLFHASLGVTFSDYLNRLRLDHCRKALRETETSITDIAFGSGFQSISQFNRRFRAAEGKSPKAYRASFRKSLDDHLGEPGRP